jgi:hypothetical protein
VKERKKMLKALKGYVAPTLFHKDAYLFILRLADVVDDSVAFNKTVWTELLANNADDAALLQFATHAKAYKVLVHLLAPQKKATFLNKVSTFALILQGLYSHDAMVFRGWNVVVL